jgi:DNA-binding response OmpR family regulator
VTRVLIVEDEPHIAEALVFLLEREGFSPSVVTDGEAAIGALGACDLVILDVMLPGRSGFDVAAAIREMEEPPRTCVLTAKGQAADRERMMALGVNAFVTKPFSNKALMETIRALLAPP